MREQFSYDVFLSHSSKDSVFVRSIANRLREDGLRVWFEDWDLRRGDNIPAKIERGLESSRTLIFFMSANTFGSDWPQLEATTFRFRDPLNKGRRFIPVRLDHSQIKPSVAHYQFIDCTSGDFELAYARILRCCRRHLKPAPAVSRQLQPNLQHIVKLNHKGLVRSCHFSPDGLRAITGGTNRALRLWDLQSRHCLMVLQGHEGDIWSVAWSADQRRVLSGSHDQTIRLWDLKQNLCERVFEGHSKAVRSVAWSPDQTMALSGSDDRTIRLWDLASGKCLKTLTGHTNWIRSVAWRADQRWAVSGSTDHTVRLWDLQQGHCLNVFEGHTKQVRRVEWTPDQRRFISCSDDATLRIWDVETGNCLRVIEGHASEVIDYALSSDGSLILSGSSDGTCLLWDAESGRSLSVLEGHTRRVRSVGWTADQMRALTCDNRGQIRVWNLAEFSKGTPKDSAYVEYTNAKVLLVGDSGVGKTGLAMRLSSNDWQPSDSTVGAWATHCRLPVSPSEKIEREIWLWDFGGQADQRLIHQLYMDDTALAVLVFDGQRENLFEILGQWDRDLTRTSAKAFTKLLVAGRVDAGALRTGRAQLEEFAQERGYDQILETSAKTGFGCTELLEAIRDGINWDNIAWRSSPAIFKQLKQEILLLKDQGNVLMRFNELSQTLQMRLSIELTNFTDAELRTVISLLAGPGMVWELKFGSWVLLRPELINVYAQAVIQTLRDDPQDRGCISERRVIEGELKYQTNTKRVSKDDERILLLAMHQALVEHALCIREKTETGMLLVFPAYYRRERPELVDHPAVQISYRFNGFLDDIYATLVVRLHHTSAFDRDQLWRYAADFKTRSGKTLGIKLRRLQEGAGELELYFDTSISMSEKITFSRFIHEHLMQKGQDVERFRHYVCPFCETPVGNRDVAMRRLAAWQEIPGHSDDPSSGPTVICIACEKRVPLWDEMEQTFASPKIQKSVRQLQNTFQKKLAQESKERAMIGEIVSTVVLAGQAIRELGVDEQPLDMEVEFKGDEGEPSGRKLFLIINPGESYLSKRKGREREVLFIKNQRFVQSWLAQDFPVLFVTQGPKGELLWMDMSDRLRRATSHGAKVVERIAFKGERLDVMGVRRWRDRELGSLLRDYNCDSLLAVLANESDARIRALAATRLAAWPENDVREQLKYFAEWDSSAEVRIACYEALCEGWWHERGIRELIRTTVATTRDEALRNRLQIAIGAARKRLAGVWESRLSETQYSELEPDTVLGYPAFRVNQFRLRNIGPFVDSGEVSLQPDVNVFLGDNASGKTTLIRCLALASVGVAAANEVVDNARAYLRKGAEQGSIEVLFELIPEPDALPIESGFFSVGLEINAESSRFEPLKQMTLRAPNRPTVLLPNSAEVLGTLRSKGHSQFGFVCAYGAVRTFSDSRFLIQSELKKPENEWVLSLFKPEAWLVNPEVFSKLIRGDTSNIEGGPTGGLPRKVVDALQISLKHLFPDVTAFTTQDESDLELRGTSLRFGDLSDGYRSLLALIGHLLRSLLRVRNWQDDPTGVHGIALVDEMDLHLHPAWQVRSVHDFCKAFPNLQLIASTHSPLVVAALKRENVMIMRALEDGSMVVDRPDFDPQGLGVAGILTGIFNLSSTIDQPTLDKITRRLLLHSKRDSWNEKEKREYAELCDHLTALGFNHEFSDPYYEQFATAMARRYQASCSKLSSSERRELNDYADRLLTSLKEGVDNDSH